jgi:hypothetical protein
MFRNVSDDEAIPCTRMTTGPDPASVAMCRSGARRQPNTAARSAHQVMRPVWPGRSTFSLRAADGAGDAARDTAGGPNPDAEL